MPDPFKKYEFTIKLKTNANPSDAIYHIARKLKDSLPILSIEYRQLEDRPTNDEHHGGITDSEGVNTDS